MDILIQYHPPFSSLKWLFSLLNSWFTLSKPPVYIRKTVFYDLQFTIYEFADCKTYVLLHRNILSFG